MGISSLWEPGGRGASCPAGNLQVLEICIFCPEACQAVVQLCVPYLSPGSSSVRSSSSIPVPLQPLRAAGTHRHPGQYLGRGRASLGCPEPTLHLPVEHPMVPPYGQEVEEDPPPIFTALLSPAGRPPAQPVLRPWRARRCSAPRHGRGGVRGPGRAGAGGPPWWRRRRPPPCRMSPSCSHPIWMTSSLKVGGNPGLHMGQGSPRAGSSHGCFCVPPRKPLQQDRDVAAGVRVSRGGRRGQTWGSLCHDAIPTGISVSPWGR